MDSCSLCHSPPIRQVVARTRVFADTSTPSARTDSSLVPFGPDNLLTRSVVRYHLRMTIDMKSLALEGAKARLWQLNMEKNELLRAFPDLRDGDQSLPTSQGGSRRGGREMTAAERRSVSTRMKKYWAERRMAKGASKRGPGRPKGSGKRKGISAAGRAAIAAAQKKRWTKLRKEGKAKAKVTGRSSAGNG
jgi:hypothetical protein